MKGLRGIAVAAAVVAAGAAQAHDRMRADGTVVDARWIEEKYPECCGRIDCEPVDQSRVTFNGQGWEVKGFGGAVRIPDVLPSDPGKGPWVCRFLIGEPPPIRCLFLPGIRG